MSVHPAVLPTEIRRTAEKGLQVTWQDGHVTVYTARTLRIACGCARCSDETTGRRLLNPASVREGVEIANVELRGRYAVNIAFSDGHNTGLYTFRFLRERCGCADCTRAREARGGEAGPGPAGG